MTTGRINQGSRVYSDRATGETTVGRDFPGTRASERRSAPRGVAGRRRGRSRGLGPLGSRRATDRGQLCERAYAGRAGGLARATRTSGRRYAGAGRHRRTRRSPARAVHAFRESGPDAGQSRRRTTMRGARACVFGRERRTCERGARERAKRTPARARPRTRATALARFS